MITPSPNVSSYTRCKSNSETILSNIYNQNNSIELITLKNQTAYGYRAIPKLSFELTSPIKETRINALAFLTKILHKPEIAAQGLTYNLVDILLLIIKDDSVIEKQLASKCLSLFTTTYVGGHSFVNEKTYFILKEELSNNDATIRKNIYEIFYYICSKDVDGVNLFLSMKMLPLFINNLKYESYELQCIILNIIYYCIQRGKQPYIPDQLINIHALNDFSSFLDPHIPAKLKIAAEKCIMSLCVFNDAKAISCSLINKLVKLLANRKREVRTNAAGALMNISINDDAKKILSSTKALSYLLDLLKDDHQDAILYSLKTLTNMSEDYTSRNQLIHKLDEIEIFLDHPNPHIINAAKRALRIINWKP